MRNYLSRTLHQLYFSVGFHTNSAPSFFVGSRVSANFEGEISTRRDNRFWISSCVFANVWLYVRASLSFYFHFFFFISLCEFLFKCRGCRDNKEANKPSKKKESHSVRYRLLWTYNFIVDFSSPSSPSVCHQTSFLMCCGTKAILSKEKKIKPKDIYKYKYI